MDAKINSSYLGIPLTQDISTISPVLSTAGFHIQRMYITNYNSARHLCVCWVANGVSYVSLFKVDSEVHS